MPKKDSHMKYDIVHEGTVKEIRGNMVVVSIHAESACGSCKVKSLCGMNDEQEKEVGVYDKEAELYHEGEKVIVGIGTAMGMKAVLWAYIMPFFLMLGTLFITREVGMSELASGGITLGVAAIYFLGLALMRKKLEREIIFKIRKI